MEEEMEEKEEPKIFYAVAKLTTYSYYKLAIDLPHRNSPTSSGRNTYSQALAIFRRYISEEDELPDGVL